jgi:protein CpxP
MTISLKRVGLGLAAALLSVGVYAATQDQNTNQTAAPFSGGPAGRGRGGPGGRFGRPGGPGPMAMLPPGIMRELNLTDGQREQVKAIAEARKDDWKALAERGRAAHEALQAAVTADAMDESVIRAKAADVAAVEADTAVARARVYAELLQLLTADQKAALKDLQARRPTPPPSGPRGRR